MFEYFNIGEILTVVVIVYPTANCFIKCFRFKTLSYNINLSFIPKYISSAKFITKSLNPSKYKLN